MGCDIIGNGSRLSGGEFHPHAVGFPSYEYREAFWVKMEEEEISGKERGRIEY